MLILLSLAATHYRLSDLCTSGSCMLYILYIVICKFAPVQKNGFAKHWSSNQSINQSINQSRCLKEELVWATDEQLWVIGNMLF